MAMCQYDKDCPFEAQACFSNVSWYTPQQGENGCLCNTYYGFSGPECTETGMTNNARLWLAMSIINVSCSFGLVVASVYLLIRLFIHGLLAFKAESVGTFQIFLGASLGIISQVGYVWAAYSPEVSGYIPFDDKNDRQNIYHHVWQGIFGIGAVAVMIAAMTIALLWIDVANKVSQMKKSVGTLRSYRMRLIAIEVIALIGIVIPVAIGIQLIGMGVAFLVALILLALYAYGYSYITFTISKMTSSSSDSASSARSPYRAVLREMRQTTIYIYVSVILAVIMSLVTLSLMVVGWKEYANPDLSLLVLFHELLQFTISSVGVCTMVFLHQFGQRQIRKDVRPVTTTAIVESTKADTIA